MDLQHIVPEPEGTTVVLRFRSGKTNPMSPGFLEDLNEVLGRFSGDPSVSSLVLWGGDSRFFSFGLDVATLLDLERPRMEEFFHLLVRVLKTVYLYPKPVVAAVNGHAMAGGLLLALATDHRVAADGDFSYGLSEVKLGLAVPSHAVRILARQVGTRGAREISLTGETMGPARARDLGLVEEIAPLEAVRGRAVTRAQELAELPQEAYALNKRFLNQGVFDVDPDREEDEQRRWMDLWFRPDSRKRLRDLVERR